MSKKKDLSYYKWPIGIVIGFAVVVSVNFFFLYIANQTSLPLVENNPYEKGLKYQEIVEQEKRYLNSGWESEFDIQSVTGESQEFALEIKSAAGEFIDGLSVQVKALRPSATQADREIAFSEEAGRYMANIPNLQKGLWIMTFLIEKEGQTYRFRQKHLIP